MSIFVIPMAGLSSRFFQAGYTVPKYQLPIGSQTMFDWSVSSFERYFHTDTFLFIVRDIYDSASFVENRCRHLGIKHFIVHTLDGETQGQAETVFLGLERYFKDSNEEIIIFNIDSQRCLYEKPEWIAEVDGYMELFLGEGDHWSFAKLDENNRVLSSAEKKRISPFCSNGLYYFKNFNTFKEAYDDAITHQKMEKGELYIAPLYNYLVASDYVIMGDIIDSGLIKFSGTPSEYLNILRDY